MTCCSMESRCLLKGTATPWTKRERPCYRFSRSGSDRSFFITQAIQEDAASNRTSKQDFRASESNVSLTHSTFFKLDSARHPLPLSSHHLIACTFMIVVSLFHFYLRCFDFTSSWLIRLNSVHRASQGTADDGGSHPSPRRD